MNRLIPALICFLALPGCAADGLGGVLQAPLASQAPAAMADVKKALAASHRVHAATANFLAMAANSNLCIQTCASTAKLYLDQSEDYLTAADKLVAVGDAAGIQAKITSATALIGSVNNLIGKK